MPQSFCRPPPTKPIHYNALQKQWGRGASATAHSNSVLLFPKSFRCKIYGVPRKCCKQRTYRLAKPFRCNTYKKPGGGGILPILERVRSRQTGLASVTMVSEFAR